MIRRHDGPVAVSRREFFTTLGAAALTAPYRPLPPLTASYRPLPPPTAQDSLPGTGPSGKLWDPSRAGRPVEPVTARDNDAAIQAIEKQIRCTCGCNLDVYTCRTTDFTCGTSPVMHRRVLALAEAGKSAQEIIDEFIKEHGVAILMAPPKRGFNLAGYFVPSLAILIGAAILTLLLWRWSRAAASPAPAPLSQDLAASPEELERLRRELEQLSH